MAPSLTWSVVKFGHMGKRPESRTKNCMMKVQKTRGESLSTEVAFTLITQRPEVQIPALQLSSWIVERSNPSRADASDFANALSGKGLS